MTLRCLLNPWRFTSVWLSVPVNSVSLQQAMLIVEIHYDEDFPLGEPSAVAAGFVRLVEVNDSLG